MAVPAESAKKDIERVRKPWYRHLYAWVLIGIAAGIGVGYFWPSVGADLQPIGTTFINAIKMIITPIIFLTVVSGIAGVDALRRVGRIGVKALIYFEVVTTVALGLGFVVMNVFHPGTGVHADAAKLKVTGDAADFIQQGETQSYWHFLTDIVPDSIVGAFSEGNVLQVLFFAILFGIAVKALGPAGAPIAAGVNHLSAAIYKVLRYIMYAAPVGAFAAMAFTVGKFGISTLTSLGKLMALFYGTSLFFVVVVLGVIAAAIRVNIFKLLRYIGEELLVVLGTSSSETVLPQLMRKLENLGAPRQIVGLAVPTGYSFNLDGIGIYLSVGALYVAQATDVNLSLGQQLGLLAVLLLTSKGAAGVTGSGFIVLAATLSAVGTIPVAGIMLIFGIDRFMSECRSMTNVCGNSLASLVVARWEGVLDQDRMRRVLNGEEIPPEEAAPETEPVAAAAGPAQPQN